MSTIETFLVDVNAVASIVSTLWLHPSIASAVHLLLRTLTVANNL